MGILVGGILWEESCGRNPVGGIPCGRNPMGEESSLGGIPWGRNPVGGIPCERNHVGRILHGRNPDGTTRQKHLLLYTCMRGTCPLTWTVSHSALLGLH